MKRLQKTCAPRPITHQKNEYTLKENKHRPSTATPTPQPQGVELHDNLSSQNLSALPTFNTFQGWGILLIHDPRVAPVAIHVEPIQGSLR